MRKSSCTSTDVSKHHRWVLLVSTVCAASTMCFTVYSSDSVLARVSKPFSGGPLAAATAFNAKSKLTAADGFSYSKAIQQVYQPRNYSVCTPANGTMTCWLQLRKEVDCATLFDEYEATLKTHVPVFPPPKELPSHLRDEFLLQNLTRLRSYYFKQADYSPDATVQVWTLDTIKGFMQKAKKGHAVGHYKKGMLTIYPAIHCHPIEGLAGAIFGTEAPWLEGLLFALGELQIWMSWAVGGLKIYVQGDTWHASAATRAVVIGVTCISTCRHTGDGAEKATATVNVNQLQA
jgi:hypothetical protein